MVELARLEETDVVFNDRHVAADTNWTWRYAPQGCVRVVVCVCGCGDLGVSSEVRKECPAVRHMRRFYSYERARRS
jgi:hypothetical protein